MYIVNGKRLQHASGPKCRPGPTPAFPLTIRVSFECRFSSLKQYGERLLSDVYDNGTRIA